MRVSKQQRLGETVFTDGVIDCIVQFGAPSVLYMGSVSKQWYRQHYNTHADTTSYAEVVCSHARLQRGIDAGLDTSSSQFQYQLGLHSSFDLFKKTMKKMGYPANAILGSTASGNIDKTILAVSMLSGDIIVILGAVIDAAMQYGHVHILDALKQYVVFRMMVKKQFPKHERERWSRTAARYGQICCLEWMGQNYEWIMSLSQLFTIRKHLLHQIIDEAILYGQADVVEWGLSKHNFSYDLLQRWAFKALSTSHSGNNAGVLKHLLRNMEEDEVFLRKLTQASLSDLKAVQKVESVCGLHGLEKSLGKMAEHADIEVSEYILTKYNLTFELYKVADMVTEIMWKGSLPLNHYEQFLKWAFQQGVQWHTDSCNWLTMKLLRWLVQVQGVEFTENQKLALVEYATEYDPEGSDTLEYLRNL
jgi:hypothetical protein